METKLRGALGGLFPLLKIVFKGDEKFPQSLSDSQDRSMVREKSILNDWILISSPNASVYICDSKWFQLNFYNQKNPSMWKMKEKEEKYGFF